MLSTDPNSLQRLLTTLIEKKLRSATQFFKRIIMSEDTIGNPAELYGKDGKIYYRNSGGVGEELSTGVGGLWQDNGSEASLIETRDIDCNQGELIDTGDVTMFDGGVLSPTLHLQTPTLEGVSGMDLVANNDTLFINSSSGTQALSIEGTTGDVGMAGELDMTYSQIIHLPTPTLDHHVANKYYVDTHSSVGLWQEIAGLVDLINPLPVNMRYQSLQDVNNITLYNSTANSPSIILRTVPSGVYNGFLMTSSPTTLQVIGAGSGQIRLMINDLTELMSITTTLSMVNNKITNVAPPTIGSDAVNKDYVDNNAGSDEWEWTDYTWVASEAWTDWHGRCIPTTPNGYAYEIVQWFSGHTTGVTEPTWPTALGDTVVDNDIVWECVGIGTYTKCPSGVGNANDIHVKPYNDGIVYLG